MVTKFKLSFFLILSLCFIFSLSNYCFCASGEVSKFEIDSGDLQRLMNFSLQQYRDIVAETSSYSARLQLFSDLVNQIETTRNMEVLSASINELLGQFYSGDLAINDYNLLFWAFPSTSSSSYNINNEGLDLYFLAIGNGTLKLNQTEQTAPQQYIQNYINLSNYSGEAINNYQYTNAHILLRVRIPYTSSSPLSTAHYISSENIVSHFMRFKFSNYKSNGEVYGYQLVRLYRSSQYPSVYPSTFIWWKENSQVDYGLYNIYYYCDLDTQYIFSGDYIPPVPSITPEPSGDTNQLISDILTTLTDTPGSGDFSRFSSGDIISSLDFTETNDPYENFWGSIISGLQNALTCTNVQSVTLDFLGNEYILSVSDFDINYPSILEDLLTISSTIAIVFAELKMWRKIVISINSGNIFNLNNQLAQNDISDLF